jgi:hypothetical protein
MFSSQVIPELIFLFFLFFGLKKKQDEKHVLILQRTETIDKKKRIFSGYPTMCLREFLLSSSIIKNDISIYKIVSLCDN